MKKIEPVQVWKNGQELEATLLNSTSQDNLINSCNFYYQLLIGGDGTEAMPIMYSIPVAEGSLTLSGEDYLAWDGTNDAAYAYIAEKLNLTLVP
jgi:hypothetical protein